MLHKIGNLFRNHHHHRSIEFPSSRGDSLCEYWQIVTVPKLAESSNEESKLIDFV